MNCQRKTNETLFTCDTFVTREERDTLLEGLGEPVQIEGIRNSEKLTRRPHLPHLPSLPPQIHQVRQLRAIMIFCIPVFLNILTRSILIPKFWHFLSLHKKIQSKNHKVPHVFSHPFCSPHVFANGTFSLTRSALLMFLLTARFLSPVLLSSRFC